MRHSMACLGLDLEEPWLAPGGPFLYMIGLREQSSHLVGPPFLEYEGFVFQSGWALVGVVTVMNLRKWVWFES